MRIYENPSAPGFLPYERQEKVITTEMRIRREEKVAKHQALSAVVIKEWFSLDIKPELCYDKDKCEKKN